MRMLVCLEHTDLSRAALPIARSIAMATSADVTLVHVVVFRGQSISEESGEVRRALEGALEGFPPATQCTVLHGANSVDAIVAYAREHAPDLIVMASHARPRLTETLLGSTTRGVVRSRVAPVLVVPSDGQAPAA